MRDGVRVARRGVPAVALVTEEFWAQGNFIARSVGIPDIPHVQVFVRMQRHHEQPYHIRKIGRLEVTEALINNQLQQHIYFFFSKEAIKRLCHIFELYNSTLCFYVLLFVVECMLCGRKS